MHFELSQFKLFLIKFSDKLFSIFNGKSESFIYIILWISIIPQCRTVLTSPTAKLTLYSRKEPMSLQPTVMLCLLLTKSKAKLIYQTLEMAKKKMITQYFQIILLSGNQSRRANHSLVKTTIDRREEINRNWLQMGYLKIFTTIS